MLDLISTYKFVVPPLDRVGDNRGQPGTDNRGQQQITPFLPHSPSVPFADAPEGAVLDPGLPRGSVYQ